MSGKEKPVTVSCIVDIPADRLEEAASRLENLGIILDPRRQVIVFNEALMSQSVALGHHLPGMVEGMNRCLEQESLTPRIPGGHKEWSIERRQAFLQFAIENFDWDDNTVRNTWWADEGITWPELVRGYPLVFEGRE